MNHFSILVVDDEMVQRETLADILRDQGYAVATAPGYEPALSQIQNGPFDVVLTDFRMPGGSGLDLARRLHDLVPETAVLIMTAYGDLQGAVEAMRAGVFDYVSKPLNIPSLLARLKFLRDHKALKVQASWLRAESERARRNGGHLLGTSPQIEEIRNTITRVAQTRGTVLITGESGTGKEVVARELHRLSSQMSGQFIGVNCSAFPDTLLESELFGFRRGAFTGAVADKPGLMALAQDGSLFLDEIGDMPAAVQAKLLRVLQEREFVPLGDTKPVRLNIRIIAATNRDLAAGVASGSFRRDLFYRLNVIHIHMPPLRERLADIPSLARHFLDRHSAGMGVPSRPLTNAAIARLMKYDWPGNIRELENVIERAMILSRDPDWITERDILLEQPVAMPADHQDLDTAVQNFTRTHILSALEFCNRDKKETARVLGIGLSSLYRKIDELGLDV